MAFFLRYTADAIAHGHLPALVTTATERPERHQPDVEHVGAVSAVAPDAGHAARRPAGQPHCLCDARVRRLAAAMYWVLRRHGASVLAGTLAARCSASPPAW